MNRTARNVAMGLAAVALLFLATGATTQEGVGGYGKLPPVSPPADPRQTPKAPKSSGRRSKPSGNAVIPQTGPTPSGGISPADFNKGLSYWPDTLRDEITGMALPEFEDGVLMVIVPTSPETTPTLLEEQINDWARHYGYKTVQWVYEAPESSAYTAEAFYKGQSIGTYDLMMTYDKDYLDLAVGAGSLMDFFAFGLVDWMHGS